MTRDPIWSSFDEARELFYAANLAYTASSRPLNAVPLLRRSALLLLRALVLGSGKTTVERDAIVAAAARIEERERVLRFPLLQDLELLDDLDRRFRELEPAVGREEAVRIEQLIEAMPRVLTDVRRHLRNRALTPQQAAARRRRKRWALAAVGLAAVAIVSFAMYALAGSAYRAVAFGGLHGSYFADLSFTHLAFERRDDEIDFDWGEASPSRNLPLDRFTVRWHANLWIPDAGRYTFYLNSDDGSRLYVGDKLVVDNWSEHAAAEQSGSVELEAGVVPIRVDYFDKVGQALIKLSWSTPSRDKQIISGRFFVR